MTFYLIDIAYDNNGKTYEYVMPYHFIGTIKACGILWFFKNWKRWYWSEKKAEKYLKKH